MTTQLPEQLRTAGQVKVLTCPLCGKPEPCPCPNARGPFRLRYKGYSAGEFTFVRLALDCFRLLKKNCHGKAELTDRHGNNIELPELSKHNEQQQIFGEETADA